MILCFLGLSSGGELSCLFLFDQYCNEIDFAKKKGANRFSSSWINIHYRML
jgi:hypothetical protein